MVGNPFSPSDTRGALAYPPFRLVGDSLFLSFDEARNNIRFLLTYFDDVCVIPLNFQSLNFCSQDEQTLVMQGVFRSFPDRNLQFGNSGQNLLLSDSANSLIYCNELFVKNFSLFSSQALSYSSTNISANSLLLSLSNACLSPDLSVPISEVIDFRLENAESFRKFHSYIDIIFEKIELGSCVEAKSMCSEIYEYSEFLSSLIRKSKFPSVAVSIDIRRSIVPATLAAIDLFFGGVGGVLSTALSNAVQLNKVSSPYASLGENFPRNFQYIANIAKKLPYSMPSDHIEYNYDVKNLCVNGSNFISAYPKDYVEESILNRVHFIDCVTQLS